MKHPATYADKISTSFVTKQNALSHVTQKNITQTLTSLPEDAWAAEVQNFIISSVRHKEEIGDIYASGHSAKIFVVENPTNHKKYLAIKSLYDKGANANKRLSNEFGFLVEAHKILNIENPNLTVKIPKPYGVLNDSGSLLLVMDYVEGMTLFARKASKVLPILYRFIATNGFADNQDELIEMFGTEDEYIDLRTDKEIKTKFRRLAQYIAYKGRAWDEKFYNDCLSFYSDYHAENGGTLYETNIAWVYDKMKKHNYLTEHNGIDQSTCEHIKDNLIEAIDILHKHHIYHNDTNHRNIILAEDGDVYLIDFDKSDTEYDERNKRTIKTGDPRYESTYKGKPLKGDYKCLRHFDALVDNISDS